MNTKTNEDIVQNGFCCVSWPSREKKLLKGLFFAFICDVFRGDVTWLEVREIDARFLGKMFWKWSDNNFVTFKMIMKGF